jgi:hypothetical protein
MRNLAYACPHHSQKGLSIIMTSLVIVKLLCTHLSITYNSGGTLGNSLVEVPIERQLLEAIMAAGPAGDQGGWTRQPCVGEGVTPGQVEGRGKCVVHKLSGCQPRRQGQA